MDRAGFEAHFVRFVQMTLFEQDGVASAEDVHSIAQIFDLVSVDLFLLLTIITPMFFAAMHFYTAPLRRKYTNKLQILSVPFAVIPFFYFTNVDVAILSGLVLV